MKSPINLDLARLLGSLAGVSREATQARETLDRKLKAKAITAAERATRKAKRKVAAQSRRKNRR